MQWSTDILQGHIFYNEWRGTILREFEKRSEPIRIGHAESIPSIFSLLFALQLKGEIYCSILFPISLFSTRYTV